MTLIAKKARLTGQIVAKPARLSSVVLGAEPATGDATADQVLEGATFSNATENGITGTMPNIGQQNITPSAEDQTISEGYHDGSGVVSGAPIANAKAAVDAANEEASADLTAGIALVDENYAAIKAEIAAKGVDMTGVIPSDYDDAIASIVAASGDAVAGDLLAGKTAATSVGDIVGTRAPAPVEWDNVLGHAGIAHPNPRFINNGDGTLTDNLTGLMWIANAAICLPETGANGVDWDTAKNACETTVRATYSDWRLPTPKEMDSLIVWDQAAQTYLIVNGFSGFAAIDYWVDATATNLSTYAFSYTLYGNALRNVFLKTSLRRYLPVRGPIAL